MTAAKVIAGLVALAKELRSSRDRGRARGLVRAVQESATIDWNLKESVRAAMRAEVRRLLAQFNYPPDKEDQAVALVIEQAELFDQEAS